MTVAGRGSWSPAYPSEEAEQVRVANEFALVVPHGLDKLVEPDGRICVASAHA